MFREKCAVVLVASVLWQIPHAIGRADDPIPPKNLDEKDNDEWKAASEQATVGDLTVFVGQVRIGQVALETLGQDSLSKEKLLSVMIAIKNHHKTKKMDYRGWSTKSFDAEKTIVARASDEFGNTYKRITFGAATDVVSQLKEGDSLYPGKSLVDLLVFERPIDNAKELRLLLPGEAIGAKEPVHLKVPIGHLDGQGVVFSLARLAYEREQAKAAEKAEAQEALLAKKKKDDADELEKTRPQREEKMAAAKLQLAEQLRKAGKHDAYKRSLKDLLEKYPNTKAAEKARKELK